MPNHFRFSLVLLALCLALTGCGVIVLPRDEATAAETTAPSVPGETTAPPATTAEPYVSPARPDAQAAADAALAALPELDFSGETLLVVTASEAVGAPLFPADGELGENRARLARNAAVTARYGVGFIPSTAGVDAIYNDALAAQNAGMYYADLLVLPAEQVGRFATAGLLRNLRNLPFWTAENDAAAAGNAVYADLGEAVLAHDQLPAVFFNRTLASSLGYDFYAAVEDGSWTWALYFEAAARAAALEGVSGHTLNPSHATRALDLCAASSGVPLVSNPVGQTPRLTTDALDALSALDAALRKFGSGESAYPVDPTNEIAGIQAFSGGGVLFCITNLYFMDWIFDSPADWGILPLPSVDGATHTPAGASAPVLCVTANNNKFELTGLTLAALNAASTDVITDAFITERLHNRLRDWQSAGMIERIADCVAYDFATLYGSGLPSLAAATTQAVRDVPVSGMTLAQIAEARAYAANAELARWFG